MPTLEPWMVSDQVLPALPKITSKEPGILMAILGIYKLANENERFGIGREQCAKSVLPFLMATSVENTLNLNQFEQYMSMVKALLEKVEKEQRNRLQQLSAGQEEQRGFQDFTEMINMESTKVNSGPDLDALSALFAPPKNGTGSNGNTTTKTGQLTLEEKKRLAAEKEKPSEPASQNKSQPMNSFILSTPTSTTNSLFDSGFSTSKPMNSFQSPPKPMDSFPSPPKANDSFSFGDFMPSMNSTSSSGFGSNSGSSPFAIPPPPSASNPIQRSGFTNFPPPPGNNPVNLNFGNPVKSSTNDDILDLFKSSPQPQRQQNSTAVDELLAMANSMPASNKGGKGRDPFADLLK
ncbi:hypothetical protein FO519_005467 [Halicephalobus sp. NKZ332]|nr:hypothetical protein FO519_005467 [Halicephalobus sp. NKZ332]